MNDKDSLIDVRSTKVQRILKQRPSRLLKNGIILILLSLLSLFFLCHHIPYNELSNVYVKLENNSGIINSEILIPYTDRAKIDTPMEVTIELQEYSRDKYGYFTCEIKNIKDSIINIEGSKYFMASAKIKANKGFMIKKKEPIKGQIEPAIFIWTN